MLSDHSDSPKDLERALSLAQQAVQANPEEGAILDTVGWIRFKMGDTERALGLIEQALSGSAGNPVIHYHMGVVLDASGRQEEAREQLEKALEGGESFPGRERGGGDAEGGFVSCDGGRVTLTLTLSLEGEGNQGAGGFLPAQE